MANIIKEFNINLNIHNTAINKNIGPSIKLPNYNRSKLQKNKINVKTNLEIICFKLEKDDEQTMLELIKYKYFFSKSEIMRWSLRHILREISNESLKSVHFGNYWEDEKFKDAQTISISCRFPITPLKILDKLISNNKHLYQSRSYMLRIALKDFLKQRKIFNYMIIDELNYKILNRFKVIAFKIPDIWINRIELYIKNKFYVSLSETVRLACQDLLIKLIEDKNLKEGEWFVNDKEILMKNEGPKSNACAKVPLTLLKLIDDFIIEKKFQNRTHFISLALKDFFKHDFSIYSNYLNFNTKNTFHKSIS